MADPNRIGATGESYGGGVSLELATLKNPSRLEHLAKEQLGMGPPPPGTVVTVKASSEPVRPLPKGERVARRGPPD